MKSPVTLLPGERTDVEGKSISNKILLSVPDREYHLIRPYLARVELGTNEVLHERSDLLRFVFFPNSGLISLVVPMENGQSVEAGVVGNEGRSDGYTPGGRGSPKPSSGDGPGVGLWP